jgi:dTDP-4-dehydrorhamnose 3,5-epimerase
MEIEELGIKGAWIARSPIHKDDRGYFREWFKAKEIAIAMGRSFDVQQGNMSSSNKGVLRGIHYSLAKSGQGKWITAISGSVWDVVVDIRPSSPTYKKWIGTELNSKTGDALFISEGLGHGFISLEDNSSVVYLLTSNYSPAEEFGIHPLDSELAISWPFENPSLSLKDASAPTLREQLQFGNLGLEI